MSVENTTVHETLRFRPTVKPTDFCQLVNKSLLILLTTNGRAVWALVLVETMNTYIVTIAMDT